MFKGINQLASLVRNAQQMGGQLQEANERLRQRRVTGAAGGGLVEVQFNGAGEALAVTIDPALFQRGEKDVVEDLLRAAVNDAQNQVQTLRAQNIQSLTAGFNLPGMEEALSQLFGGPSNPTS